jgi:predicted transcriptional regulator
MNNLDLFRLDFVVSIKPEYALKIIEGCKTVELRRRFPFATVTGAIIFVYASAPVQALIGYATIKNVEKLDVDTIWDRYNEIAFIDRDDYEIYFRGVREGFVVHLGDPVKLPRPIDLATLKSELKFTPPQSFAYADDRSKRLACRAEG